ncbi:MAG: valine--tRNA ligase, partial [Chitinophagales bacterium]
MELSKNYIPGPIEEKWYRHWLEKKYFNSIPDSRSAYTMVIPPPNVTGVLHMGHTLNETVQDILVRRARMNGFNACWVPGTDHASIATEAKVVSMLREKGISKSSLSREEFLGYTWDWKEKYGGIILEQLRKLGTSIDWNRVNFTMDPDYYQAVIKVFVDLYKKGLIYREKRMVNWDPRAKTALSDEEVIYREVQGKLYFIKYPIVNSEQFITIATVRPETILADAAIAVHPKDERYQAMIGKQAYIPLIQRAIPIIADEYVDPAFGTGALKITPAHDQNDHQLGIRHRLPVFDILNDDGTLNDQAILYIGLDRFEARKKIIEELQKKGYLFKSEDYLHQVGFSERTDVVVEPALRIQWWVSMKSLAEPALKVVIENKIVFYPAKFKNLYCRWMENIRDWCISRHLQWGHRIPAWYDDQGNFYVAHNEAEAKMLYAAKNPGKNSVDPKLTQDEDVLDTWFSSWLWPIEVFKGISRPENAEVNYYYPTDTLVTAPEIIFFWVARMIMAGLEYKKEVPFRKVYFTGIVRDKLGRKMSKSLGNSPDLLELIDRYGADAVRFGIMISSPAGNDLLYDEASLEQGRNFNNKIWNALKLVQMWGGRIQDGDDTGSFAIRWFENRLSEAVSEIEKLYQDFRLSEALKMIYSLIWDDFCSWYLEWIKPGFEQPVSRNVYKKTIGFFDRLMQLLHPFMPFITEEIYHLLKERKEDLCVSQLQPVGKPDHEILNLGEELKLFLTAGRELRQEHEMKQSTPIQSAII